MIHLLDFFRHLSMVRGLAPCSMETYKVSLKLFAVWLAENRGYSSERVTAPDIADWLASERERGCSPASCNNRLVAVRGYYDYLCRFHGLGGNPAADLRPMKKPKVLPESIEEETMQSILQQFDRQSWRGTRSYAIILCLYMCGLRITELRMLNIADVSFSENTMRINGKGSRQRIIPMSTKVREAFRNWLKFRWGDDDALFTDNFGKRLTDDKLRYIIKQSLLPYVPAKLAHPHALRHTFATTLVRHNVPLPTVSRLMGHASLATTFIYISAAEPQVNPFDLI